MKSHYRLRFYEESINIAFDRFSNSEDATSLLEFVDWLKSMIDPEKLYDYSGSLSEVQYQVGYLRIVTHPAVWIISLSQLESVEGQASGQDILDRIERLEKLIEMS